jgi:hypothetical protein
VRPAFHEQGPGTLDYRAWTERTRAPEVEFFMDAFPDPKPPAVFVSVAGEKGGQCASLAALTADGGRTNAQLGGDVSNLLAQDEPRQNLPLPPR